MLVYVYSFMTWMSLLVCHVLKSMLLNWITHASTANEMLFTMPNEIQLIRSSRSEVLFKKAFLKKIEKCKRK